MMINQIITIIFDAMKKELVKVSTYATNNKLSKVAVYNKIKKGQLPFKVIDGVIFVSLDVENK